MPIGNLDLESVYIGLMWAAVFVPVIGIGLAKVEKKRLLLLGHTLVLVLAARLAVSMHPDFYQELLEQYPTQLNGFERAADSFVHALQTISMDEDYTLYTVAGKAYLAALGMPRLAWTYGILNSLLNGFAPVMGGAILLDILMDFFPGMRLLFSFRRHKFVFSELNMESITLAEDICRDRKYRKLIRMRILKRKPVILFSDAYLDDEQEACAELHRRARAIGALCIKKDVLDLILTRSKSVSYFLIDADARTNISTLGQLLKPVKGEKLRWPKQRQWLKMLRRVKNLAWMQKLLKCRLISRLMDHPRMKKLLGWLKKVLEREPVTRIFVFRQDDSGNAMIRKICSDNPDVSDFVVVRPIQELTNAAFNLMYEVPLFLPLLFKTQKQDLHVTIMGDSPLAEEAFKAAFWCGQIAGVRLHLNVIAPNATAMEKRIKSKYPELIESCRENAELLQVRPGQYNPPYCEVPQFRRARDMSCASSYPRDLIRNSDYFIVAMGDDQKNLQVIDQLKVLVTRELMMNARREHPVIAPALLDPSLARAAQVLKPAEFEPYLVPFASRDSRYSCKTVFLTNFTEREITVKSIYQKKNQQKDQEDLYTTQSSAARLVHAPYKLYGLGLLQEIDLRKPVEDRYRIGKKLVLTQEQEDQFAWVEHRRWNAYMRSQGFICPTQQQYDTLFAQTGKKKSIPLKLHPCLVESDVTPTRLALLDEFKDPRYDRLDYVTMYSYRLQCRKKDEAENLDALIKSDYKKYDYLCYDAGVLELLTAAE